MFAFDLPFLFLCGIILGYLTSKSKLTEKLNYILGLSLLFIFQAGGIMLWFDILPNSKEFMIIPFNMLGMTTTEFEPVLAAILFGLEPVLLLLGEIVMLRKR
ncbi:MAG: hypothetical protein ACFFAU_14500 [Candidatus Hodarchaeota archaeon]